MLVYRSLVAAAIFGGALLVGCTAPDQPTDLRKDGPPHVTSVVVMSDLRTALDPDFPESPFDLSRLLETATFCSVGDTKRPGLVGLPTLRTSQVCPDDLMTPATTNGNAEGAPPNWYVRVVFDELLDPSVEELIDQLDANMKPTGIKLGSLLNTKPVTLKCGGVNVPYNGFYAPNGNRISWPLGPNLFIQPLSAVSVPTGASCEVALQDNVKNKKGQAVEGMKSFTFKIAPQKLRFSVPDPSDKGGDTGALVQDVAAPVVFYFTAAIGALPSAADITIISGANGAGNTANAAVCGGTGDPVAPGAIIDDPTVVATKALLMDLFDSASAGDDAWLPGTTYLISFKSTASITAKQGGAPGTFPSTYKLCFHTPAAM